MTKFGIDLTDSGSFISRKHVLSIDTLIVTPASRTKQSNFAIDWSNSVISIWSFSVRWPTSRYPNQRMLWLREQLNIVKQNNSAVARHRYLRSTCKVYLPMSRGHCLHDNVGLEVRSKLVTLTPWGIDWRTVRRSAKVRIVGRFECGRSERALFRT